MCNALLSVIDRQPCILFWSFPVPLATSFLWIRMGVDWCLVPRTAGRLQMLTQECIILSQVQLCFSVVCYAFEKSRPQSSVLLESPWFRLPLGNPLCNQCLETESICIAAGRPGPLVLSTYANMFLFLNYCSISNNVF